MKKIFISLILCLCMVSSIAFAKPSVDFNSGNRRIDIHGISDTKSGAVTVSIVSASDGMAVFSDADKFTSNLHLFHDMNTDANGSYSGKFVLPASAPTGTDYAVYVSGDSEPFEFYFADEAEIDSCISEFDTATVGTISGIITKYTITKNVLGTTASDEYKAYESVANIAMIELLDKETSLDVNAIIECLGKAAEAGVLMQGTADEVEAALTENSNSFAIDSAVGEDELSSMLISLRTNEPIADDEKLLDYIPETIKIAEALIAVNKAAKGNEMITTLENYKTVLSLSEYSRYKSLSDENKIKVNEYIAAKGFDSLGSLKSAFKKGMDSLSSSGSGSAKDPGPVGSAPSGNTTSKYEIGGSSSNIGGATQGNSQANIFNDIKSVSWAESAILNLSSLGIVSGYGNGEYRPMNNVTRAELTKLVYSLKADEQTDSNKTIKVATVGDSLTQGFIGDDGKYTTKMSYSDYLRNNLGSGYEVTNFGISSYGIYKRHEYSYTSTNEYKASLEYNPDVVVIMFGTNDAKTMYWDDIKNQYAEIYKDFVQSYASLSSSPEIICILPPPVFGDSKFAKDRPEQNMNEIRQIIANVANEMNCTLINAYEMFEGRELLFPDGLHYNKNGANEIAVKISETIKSVGNSAVSFADVGAADWYSEIVTKAAKDGIVNGSGGMFYPNNSVTREDAAVIIYRFISKYKSFDSKKQFADINDISDYAKDAVSFLAGAGLINGMGNDMFAPKALLTRAEAAVMVNSALSFIK